MELITDATMNITTFDVTTEHSHGMEHSLLTSIIATVTLSVIIIVSICANVLATSTILRVRLLRQNLHNHLIVNLNVISMFITVFSMPLTLVSIFDNGMFLEENMGLCLFNGFSSIAFPVASSFTVLWIAVDRYLTVVWSNRFPPSHLRTIFMIVSTWVISCVVAILPLFEVLSEYYYMHDTHHCSPVWDMCEFYFVVFFAVYGLSIPIMVISYVFVVYHLCKKERKMQAHQSFRSRSRFSRSDRSVRRSKRIKAGRPKQDQGSSLVVYSSQNSNGVGPKKEKAHHDSGYVSPPKNSIGGTDSPPESAGNLNSAVYVQKFENPNKNNSASTDDGTDESRLSMCVRKGSVREMIKYLERNNNKQKSKYDSLPKLRRKRNMVSNDLRKAASADDVLDYETPLTDINTSKKAGGSPHHNNEDNRQGDELNAGVSGEMPSTFPSESVFSANMTSPPEYNCYDEEDTTMVTVEVGFIPDGNTEADYDVERTSLSKQDEESQYPLVPDIIVEDVSEGVSGPESSDEDNPNSSIYSSQNDESHSTLPTASLDQGHLAVSDTSSEDGEVDERHDKDVSVATISAGNAPALQFSISVEYLAEPDKEKTPLTEFQQKRAGSVESLSSMRQISGSGTDTSKLKRGSTRRPSIRPTLTADKQVALMGGLLVLTAVICWTPYFVIHSCFFPMDIAPHWSSILTMWLGYLNAMLNPLIYSFTNRRIRSMLNTFCGRRCRQMRALLCRKRTQTVTKI